MRPFLQPVIGVVTTLVSSLAVAAGLLLAHPASGYASAGPAACGEHPTGRVLLISLDQQELTACQDGASIVDTPVTTGRPALPTPPGSYSVFRKNHPWTMRSPWPRSSPYWYPPSRVEYTLWFRPGYAIHDAPWRARYGPGTQAEGTHGCVNVPRPAMDQLYTWAQVGTPVVVS
jgi:lipoprotein-anchoring transpeptidase ErfK/SrfK